MANSRKKAFMMLAEGGAPIGEVFAVNQYLVRVRGLHPVTVHALVLFEDGSKGIVQDVEEDHVAILHFGTDNIAVGTSVVLQHPELVVKVGEDFIGRVVSVTGEPLDGKGAIAADGAWPVFNDAPALIEREQLSDQLETGITIIDALFPLVYGQRIALIGDDKTGKSTITTQIAQNQGANGETVTIYVLIAKSRSDIDDVVNQLTDTGAMKNTIVIVSTLFDALPLSWLAPYVACTMGEYLWQNQNKDVVVIYDDLTNHAHVHREIALLSEKSPGRDSYPGDTFYSHSTLLERAGKLSKNNKSLTALPVVHAPSGDFTGYIPTNIMSITDGQWIMDAAKYHDGDRPAISTGLSVSRVGGRGHNKRQQEQAARVLRLLNKYYEARDVAHFGSELALEVKHDIENGQRLLEILRQKPFESFSLLEQQLMLEVLLKIEKGAVIDNAAIKLHAPDFAKKVKTAKQFDTAVKGLLDKVVIESGKK